MQASSQADKVQMPRLLHAAPMLGADFPARRCWLYSPPYVIFLTYRSGSPNSWLRLPILSTGGKKVLSERSILVLGSSRNPGFSAGRCTASHSPFVKASTQSTASLRGAKPCTGLFPKIQRQPGRLEQRQQQAVVQLAQGQCSSLQDQAAREVLPPRGNPRRGEARQGRFSSEALQSDGSCGSRGGSCRLVLAASLSLAMLKDAEK